MSAPQPLARVTSIKVKLGLLVAASGTVAALVGTLGRAVGVTPWLGIPVTLALALAVTQLLATGMTSPLREMTAAARRMATGDHAVRVTQTSGDEVGELARAFNTMAGDLAAVDRQRRELVANVSHELRTPLAGLCAVLENLADGVGAHDPEALHAALAQAERTGRLVDDLLDLARVDAGRAPLAPESVPTRALLDAAVAESSTLGRDVVFDVRVDPGADHVLADPDRLRQLVANLLDNASRHSPPGGTVLLVASRNGDRFRLEVRDRGPGVDPPDRDRVFEPFGTLSAPDGGGGTGLGLAIARWVTDLHGGTIRFVEPADPPDRAPDVGRAGDSAGARVRVELPLRPPDRRPRESPVPTSAPEAVPQPPPAPSASGTSDRPDASGSLLDDLFGGFWPDRAVPARLGILAAAVATGALGGAVLPDRSLGLGTALVVLVAGAVVLAASRRRDPFALLGAGLCVLLVTTAAVRDADWIVTLCLLAGAGLGAVAVTGGRTLASFMLAGLAWPLAALRGLPWLGRTLTTLTGLGRGAAVLRTTAWCLLGLVVFGALFASADALLARWAEALVPDLRPDTAVARAFVTVAVGGAVLAAAYVALDPPRVERRAAPPRTVGRRFEWLAPVVVVNAVFAALLVAQGSAALAGDAYLQRATGLTYAEYATQGFGQLTAATALMLVVVWGAARKAPRTSSTERWWLRGSLGLLCLQTLAVVGTALNRMHLYQEAYGFTRLRLLVDVFEGWLGLLVLALLASGVTLRASWLPRFALVSGVIALLGIAAVNPDAWIARHNIDRFAETGRVDWAYLAGLSDDAVPALADLPPDLRPCALAGRSAGGEDWLEWNLGHARAAAALAPGGAASWEPPAPAGCPGGD